MFVLFLITAAVVYTQPLSAGSTLMAHRAHESVIFPAENTAEGISATLALPQTTMVEVDIRLTSDGVPILMHDSTVDRTTDGTGTVSSLSYSDIQSLSVLGAGGATYAVPTLDDALDAFTMAGGDKIFWDLRTGLPEVAAAFDAYGFDRSNVIVRGQTMGIINFYQTEFAGSQILWNIPLAAETTFDQAFFDSMHDLDIAGFNLSSVPNMDLTVGDDAVTRTFINDAHRNGFFTYGLSFTNDRTRNMIGYGVDIIDVNLSNSMGQLFPETGDTNQDGILDLLDWENFMDHAGMFGGWAWGNFNDDWLINYTDFSLLRTAFYEQGSLEIVAQMDAWNESQGFAGILNPEPSTYVLLGSCLAVTLYRRRGSALSTKAE